MEIETHDGKTLYLSIMPSTGNCGFDLIVFGETANMLVLYQGGSWLDCKRVMNQFRELWNITNNVAKHV